MGRRATGYKTSPIRIREDTYRIVEAMKNDAKRQGHKLTATDILHTCVEHEAYRAKDDMMALSKREERMIKKLLRAMRQPGPAAVRRGIVGLIEEILDTRAARGVSKE